MNGFHLRTDLERVRLGDFALPLGIESTELPAPIQGYTLSYNIGEDEEPDTYTFCVVVSHERLAPIVRWAFTLLPEEVWPIVEIDSADAYRTIDVYVGDEDAPVSREELIQGWLEYEPLLLEEGSVGIGANADDPFVEIFLDQWKTLMIHVPLDMRERIEQELASFHLREVAETWPNVSANGEEIARIRPVLDLAADEDLGLEDLLLDLKQRWSLVLNVDPDRNLDESGRELGLTLWHVIAMTDAKGEEGRGAYVSLWLSARSLAEAETLAEETVERMPEWVFVDVYSVNRVAYDERPDELRELEPRRTEPAVHLVHVDEWETTEDA